MLAPDLIDVLLRTAAQRDEDYVNALQDAATYRYIAQWALNSWHREMELRRRTELRLREVLTMPEENGEAC